MLLIWFLSLCLFDSFVCLFFYLLEPIDPGYKVKDLLSDSHLRKLFRDILYAYGRIDLGTIGCLRLKSSAQEIVNQKIQPPKHSIEFEATEVLKEEIFAKAINDQTICHQEYLDLKKHIQESIAKFKIIGSAEIGGLGILKKEGENIKWQSHLASPLLHPLALPLPIPKETPIVHKHSHEKAPPPNFDIDQPKGNRYYAIPIIIAILGTILLISLYRLLLPTEDTKAGTTKPDILEIAADDVSPFVDDEDTSRLFKHPLLEKYKDVLNEDIIAQGCEIVVGSFSSLPNAENLEEEVLSEGYRAYINTAQNLHRVVITFDCLEHDLTDKLREVRMLISEKAWYLQPNFQPDDI